MNINYYGKVLLLSVLTGVFFIAYSAGQIHSVVTDRAQLVKTTQTNLWNPPAPDTAGITYLPSGQQLLVSDSEVDEMPIFANANLYYASPTGGLQATGNTLALRTSPSREPTGVSFDASTGHLFFSDDDAKRIYELTAGTDGRFGTADDAVSYFSTTPFGATDPESIAVGQGSLWIGSGVDHKVFQTSKTGSLISSFDTGAYNLNDLEGVAYYPDSGTVFVLSLNPKMIGEFTTAGSLIRYIDISTSGSVAPADLVFAPTSNPADNPNLKNIYIVDRGVDNNTDPGENDGRIYEMSLTALPTNPTPTLTNGLTPSPTRVISPSLQPSGTRPLKYYGVDRANPLTDANYSTLSQHYVQTAVVETDINAGSSVWQNIINLSSKYNYKIVILPVDWVNNDTNWPNCSWGNPYVKNNPSDYIYRVKPLLNYLYNAANWPNGQIKVIGIFTAHEAMWTCLASVSEMSTIRTQLKNYVSSNFGRDIQAWNYIDNVTDMTKLSDYSGLADIGKIMDVAVTWQHCFGGAEGTCPQAQQKIINDRNAINSAGLNGKVDLVFLFQTFAKGSGYRMPNATEMYDWSCSFLNTGALDGFIWYTWGACWYDSDLWCPTATHPNQNLWPVMNNVYNSCIKSVTVSPSPTPPIGQNSAGLKFNIRLPDVDSTVTNISAADSQVELKDGTLSLSKAGVDLVRSGNYFQTRIPVTFNINQNKAYTISIKSKTSLRRQFSGLFLTSGQTLDCSVATNSNCGELISQRDNKLLFSGDSDGFNTASGSFNKVDSADLQVLAIYFNQPATGQAANADYNLDSQVNINDLEILGRNYGKTGD